MSIQALWLPLCMIERFSKSETLRTAARAPEKPGAQPLQPDRWGGVWLKYQSVYNGGRVTGMHSMFQAACRCGEGRERIAESETSTRMAQGSRLGHLFSPKSAANPLEWS
ncbi:MAG: hypothetical protein ACKVQQ_22330 [Burkholderiales bacterium]